MKAIEVRGKKDAYLFLDVVTAIYNNDKNYIRPLDVDVEKVFDAKQNKYYRSGAAQRWILIDHENKTIGRIAAFYTEKSLTKELQPTGGIGFFECVNNQEAANMLFSTAEKWLKSAGAEAVDGPINFGERDRWWGLLVEGFEPAPYCSSYNPPYYQSLFENYGFRVYFKQFTYSRKIADPLPEAAQLRAKRILDDSNYRFEYIKINQLDAYTNYFLQVYNNSWGKFPGFQKMEKRQAALLMKTLKPIMDPKLLWYAFYKDQPIAFFISLPEINQIVAKLNGKFGLWQKLLFMYMLKTKKVDKIFGVVFGVDPAFQGKGVESAILQASTQYYHHQNQYKDLELVWIGDFNPKMLKLIDLLEVTQYRTLITYRLLFDRNLPYSRHPMVGVN